MSTLTIDQIVAIRKLSKNDIDFARDIADFVLATAEQAKSCTTCQTRIAHLENITNLQLEVITYLENRLESMRASFHVNMIRAYPTKSHEEIEAEIDKALQSPAPVSQPVGYEQQYALMEAERNAAVEEYIKARPQLDNLHNRRIFEAGFKRGYEVKPTIASTPVSETPSQPKKDTDAESRRKSIEDIVKNLQCLERDAETSIRAFGEEWAADLATSTLGLLEEYSDTLRGLACWLSAGGFNSDGLIDPITADAKIRWGVDYLTKSSQPTLAAPPVSDIPSQTDSDSMCPNCVTPWKCNGPHIQPTLADPTHSEKQESYAYILIAPNGNAANTVFTKEEAENITSMSMFKHLRIVPVWDRPAPHQPSHEQVLDAGDIRQILDWHHFCEASPDAHLNEFDAALVQKLKGMQSQPKQSTGSEGL